MRYILNIAILLLISSCSDETDRSAQHTNQAQQKQLSVASAAHDDSKLVKNQNVEAKQDVDLLPKDHNTIENSLKADSNLVNDNVKEANNKEQVKLDLNIIDEDIVLGDKNTEIVFIEYFSPTCPHCAYYHKNVFPVIKAKYIDSNKITYVIREFIGNKQDLDAALLARCTGDKDSFVKFTNILLQQQESWSLTNKYREILTNIGQLGGVSPQKYSECLANNELVELLISNSKLVAREPKFIGTPAFFINGVQFISNYSVEGISEVIDQYLLQKK
ncbi:MAG: protein-disulfide reductase [Rickettsiaceae bacterium]|nr:MAG: protein-disulfide reductase [Rickettsiaceae bacterium]